MAQRMLEEKISDLHVFREAVNIIKTSKQIKMDGQLRMIPVKTGSKLGCYTNGAILIINNFMFGISFDSDSFRVTNKENTWKLHTLFDLKAMEDVYYAEIQDMCDSSDEEQQVDFNGMSSHQLQMEQERIQGALQTLTAVENQRGNKAKKVKSGTTAKDRPYSKPPAKPRGPRASRKAVLLDTLPDVVGPVPAVTTSPPVAVVNMEVPPVEMNPLQQAANLAQVPMPM